ncbi:hypothetical protein MKJ04_08105 [Pontibacter sp. E15-1]|uniref:hypothetical protein n=1 Tax=Pontibacter sp. E15-1 TaxID=2919918 RepID=UPI001F500DCF|nr:hypothetical protein [Pontibacter sp. E15-1]MCJ8164804.1 hypothetical protein [Pontibacter sp. E15-1]
MIKTSTQNELIQYVYDDLADDAYEQLEGALVQDMELADSCAELLLIQKLLDEAVKAPRQHAINNILNYSKRLSLQS